jgi:hypothetical protein
VHATFYRVDSSHFSLRLMVVKNEILCEDFFWCSDSERRNILQVFGPFKILLGRQLRKISHFYRVHELFTHSRVSMNECGSKKGICKKINDICELKINGNLSGKYFKGCELLRCFLKILFVLQFIFVCTSFIENDTHVCLQILNSNLSLY